MKKTLVSCRCCGTCCLANLIAYVNDEDLSRWQRENRQDILQIIKHGHIVWMGDHMISADDGHYAQGCPFLAAENQKGLCSIYETRPMVCRAYRPGSSEICPQWAPSNRAEAKDI